MATTFDYELHDHAGLRWLIPFIVALVVGGGWLLLLGVYPWHQLLK